MYNPVNPTMLTYAPQAEAPSSSIGRLPAAPGSAQRFEMLMYSPAGPASAASFAGTSALERSGLRHYVEALSRRWEAGQSALKRMTEAGEFTSQELIRTQVQMINCALDVEVSSKCASMFENGVQTLVQRGS